MACRRSDIYLFGFTLFLTNVLVAESTEYCENYVCEEGHCCGNQQCCTYYYELWWFWLIWFVVAALCICCFYQQKRIRRRRRQENRQNSNNVSPPILEAEKVFKLPTYDEANTQPKDPPKYNVLYLTNIQQTQIGCPAFQVNTPADGSGNSQSHQTAIDESSTAGLLANEITQDVHDGPPPLYNGQLFSSTDSMTATPPPYTQHGQHHILPDSSRDSRNTTCNSDSRRINPV